MTVSCWDAVKGPDARHIYCRNDGFIGSTVFIGFTSSINIRTEPVCVLEGKCKRQFTLAPTSTAALVKIVQRDEMDDWSFAYTTEHQRGQHGDVPLLPLICAEMTDTACRIYILS
jgi:hypothetical protein